MRLTFTVLGHTEHLDFANRLGENLVLFQLQEIFHTVLCFHGEKQEMGKSGVGIINSRQDLGGHS